VNSLSNLILIYRDKIGYITHVTDVHYHYLIQSPFFIIFLVSSTSFPERSPVPPFRIKRFALSLVLALFFPFLAACAGQRQAELSMLPSDRLPTQLQSAPTSVREAYRFAAANPDLMKQIPCYCGCGAVGHTSNYACYVSGQGAQGQLAFEFHALGCSICVDIFGSNENVTGLSISFLRVWRTLTGIEGDTG